MELFSVLPLHISTQSSNGSFWKKLSDNRHPFRLSSITRAISLLCLTVSAPVHQKTSKCCWKHISLLKFLIVRCLKISNTTYQYSSSISASALSKLVYHVIFWPVISWYHQSSFLICCVTIMYLLYNASLEYTHPKTLPIHYTSAIKMASCNKY